MRIQVLPILLLLLFCPSSNTEAQTNKATKFDDFGDINSSDLKARLDNFAVQLQQEPSAKAFVMIYRSSRDIPGLNVTLGVRIRRYLVQTRGLPQDRIVVVNGGVASCLAQELWIVPPNTAPTPRQDARIGYFQFSDSAWKFLEYSYVPAEEVRRYKLQLEEDIDNEYLEAFVEVVDKQPGDTACVIVYAQYNPKGRLVDYTDSYEPVPDIRLDRPGTAQKRMARESSVLIKTLRLSPNKLRVIYGGYRKRRAVELWVVPQGESLPVPTPNSYPKSWKSRPE